GDRKEQTRCSWPEGYDLRAKRKPISANRCVIRSEERGVGIAGSSGTEWSTIATQSPPHKATATKRGKQSQRSTQCRETHQRLLGAGAGAVALFMRPKDGRQEGANKM